MPKITRTEIADAIKAGKAVVLKTLSGEFRDIRMHDLLGERSRFDEHPYEAAITKNEIIVTERRRQLSHD